MPKKVEVMLKRMRVTITGRVQGIFYRTFIKENAEELQVKGYVKNLPTGQVEAVFEGQGEKINEMLKRCKKGPKLAMIKNIEIKEERPTKEWTAFIVLRE